MTGKKSYPNKKNDKKKKKPFRVVITFISVIVIIVISFIAAFIFGNWLPRNEGYILGFRGFVTLSESMGPSIQKGSFVVIRRVNAEALSEGDIITYEFDTEAITKRIVEVKTNDEGIFLITKADSVESIISRPIPSSDVLGRYVFSISYIGDILVTVRNPVFLSIALPIIIILYIGSDVVNYYKRRQRKKNRRKTQVLKREPVEPIEEQPTNSWQQRYEEIANSWQPNHAKTPDAGWQPNHAEAPAASWQPKHVETPAASWQPNRVETPAASWQPNRVETPAASWQPNRVETPAVSWQPNNVETPVAAWQQNNVESAFGGQTKFRESAIGWQPMPNYGSSHKDYNEQLVLGASNDTEIVIPQVNR